MLAPRIGVHGAWHPIRFDFRFQGSGPLRFSLRCCRWCHGVTSLRCWGHWTMLHAAQQGKSTLFCTSGISKCTSKTSMQFHPFSHWTKCCFFESMIEHDHFSVALQRIAGIHSHCPRGNSLWLSLSRSVLLHWPNELRQSGGQFYAFLIHLISYDWHKTFLENVQVQRKGFHDTNWTLCRCEAPGAGLTTSSTGRIILPDTTAPTLTLYECVPCRRFLQPNGPNTKEERGAFFKAKIFSSKGSTCNLDSKLRLTGHVKETIAFQISTWQFLMYMMWFFGLDYLLPGHRWFLPGGYYVRCVCTTLQSKYSNPHCINTFDQRITLWLNIVTYFFNVKFDHNFCMAAWPCFTQNAKDPAPQALDPPRTCLRNGDAAQHRYWRIRI